MNLKTVFEITENETVVLPTFTWFVVARSVPVRVTMVPPLVVAKTGEFVVRAGPATYVIALESVKVPTGFVIARSKFPAVPAGAVNVISVPLTIVKALLVPPSVSSDEVVKLEPVTVIVPPVSGMAAGDTAVMTGTNGKVMTGLSCQRTKAEVVPAKATTTEKL